MTILGVKKQGKKMATPHLKSLVKEAGDKYDDPTVDWKATPDIHQCGVCNGSGFDYKDGIQCIGCDGSGIDYELHYGVEGGKCYAYVVQYGLDALIEYCKACREAEVEKIRVNAPILNVLALPAYARIDMIAEGIPVDEMVNRGDRELLNLVAERYPQFLKTNLKSF